MAQNLGRFRGHARLRPQQEQLPTLAGSPFSQQIDAIGAGDPLGQRPPLATGGPQQAHAIGQHQISVLQHSHELGLALRGHHEFGIGRAHLPRDAFVHKPGH